MTVEEATPGEVEPSAVDVAVEAGSDPREDGRTRCAWVRGRPEHFEFHDAEWGRLPLEEAPCFERVLLTCLQRDVPLVDVLDRRGDVYESFGEWNAESLAGASDEALTGLLDRGGIFDDEGRLRWLRDIAASSVEVAKEFKGLRGYFLAMPGLTAEEQLSDVISRFAGFTKADAAELIQMVGCVGGALEQLSHDRDCWIA